MINFSDKKMDHAYGDMLKDVSQVFGQLSEKYPILEESLKRTYKEIEGLHQEKENTDELGVRKKQRLRRLLEYSIDMTPLNTTYGGLLEEVASNEVELINLLKKLSQAIIDSKKKILSFAVRQGLLLKEAKETFETVMYKHVRDSCGFSGSYSNFLISLFKLFEEYPRLCYCSVPIRTFCSNMKLIREICSEHKVFWSNLS